MSIARLFPRSTGTSKLRTKVRGDISAFHSAVALTVVLTQKSKYKAGKSSSKPSTACSSSSNGPRMRANRTSVYGEKAGL